MDLIRGAFRHSRNYHLAIASEAMSPLVRAAVRPFTRPPSPPSAWRTGLIISHTHVGDVLYKTPSLPHLARLLPQCKWYYLCSDESAPVLEGRDDLAGVLSFVAGEDSWTLKPGAFATLRAHRFDVALCPNTLRRYPDLLLSIALGIPNRVSYTYKGLSGLLTRRVRVRYPSPFPAYFRSMVGQLADAPDDWPLTPTLPITPAQKSAADALFDSLRVGDAPVLACCPTTRQGHGAWPAIHFLSAAENISAVTGARVVLCGAAVDRPLLEQLASRSRVRADVLAGALPIVSFASFLSRCAAALTQDSAPRHLANAVGTPVVFLRNMSVSRIETGVYCDSETDAAPSDEFIPDDRLAEVFEATSPAAIADLVIEAMSSPRAGARRRPATF